jgi:hypothetical protein
MSKGTPVFLEVNPKANTYQVLAKALDGVWKNEVRLPFGMTVRKSSPSMLVVTVHRTAFVIEYDALAILSIPPLKLAQPFLIPPNRVLSIELKRTALSLAIFAICRGTSTVSLKEAKRLSRKNSLPPGVHDPAALFVTGRVSPRVVQGGLPSLGKRR